MLRQFTGLCAAAALLAMSGAAHALKIFTDAQTTATAVMEATATAAGSFTYGAETFLSGDANMTEASDESDTATYYNIGGDDVHLAAPVGIAANTGDNYIVAFTLDGMVFQEAALPGDLTSTGATFAWPQAVGWETRWRCTGCLPVPS